ncbi:acyl-CoA thioesterase [Arenibacterium halophilum]|uniref:Acyl-CoA thioesterase n=1 Tax=Arenibacterium halophilum TaxID=2583821 RepID=A0ABY2XBA4_9RHOB|nr:acyl-CoA thioesterase [Arenibacterium halophilum]TMV13027.1 acyl-CoA thioesterase [Arenibacterium halophilum]
MAVDFFLDIPISFGHCDPAGIVFYPNYYRWFDRCFHTFLQERGGGHRALCAKLDARGIGLMDSGARFPAPASEGDLMTLSMTIAEWGSKTLRLAYEGQVSGRTVVEGFEVRGMFVERDGRLRAGDMAELRAALSGV